MPPGFCPKAAPATDMAMQSAPAAASTRRCRVIWFTSLNADAARETALPPVPAHLLALTAGADAREVTTLPKMGRCQPISRLLGKATDLATGLRNASRCKMLLTIRVSPFTRGCRQVA